ncbi:polysaccharide pyruvyl transferase family protein [Streptomyces hoynatensis]|uniref:Polysaccharide pyruvyl transferase family protein n=1 Tax=Streptomyces hoynatensis TaxID=1141874 RepID=A0A3A9YXX1_9ACTN|nr:polysaccharide pyruvyl transferase family protein [Streptomyces hoynatensis]RKN40087.1 polysaccharide pyruvyl transferase family protein [Streptomyces hoynatensis]
MKRAGGRTLLTGWFSFVEGEATAGDLLALQRVRAVLDRHGQPYDVAFSPRFRPDGLSLDDARPADYDRLLFVCGPLHGPRLAELHERFAHCHRVAVGTSLVDAEDPAVTGFHTVLPRDGEGTTPALDLSLHAPRVARTPVVGVLLTRGQREYADRRMHETVAEAVTSWLAEAPCAPVMLESRLDTGDGTLCATADQLLSALERVDAVVTDRLHGLVLALRVGVPALAVDPVRGGAKVTAQAKACDWPALVPAERLERPRLDAWLEWCLDGGREQADRRRAALAGAADPADGLPAVLGI